MQRHLGRILGALQHGVHHVQKPAPNCAAHSQRLCNLLTVQPDPSTLHLAQHFVLLHLENSYSFLKGMMAKFNHHPHKTLLRESCPLREEKYSPLSE